MPELKTADSCKDIRLEDGSLPEYAWPGGYPILYLASDGESFCPDCANNDPEVKFQEDHPNSGWEVVGWFIHYEGSPERCCNCNKVTESAYGDPDEPGTELTDCPKVVL